MFKQIIVTVVSMLFSYILTKQIVKKKFNKFYFVSDIVKYPIKSKLKKAIMSKFSEISLNNIVFYTTERINHNNYIYSIANDYYYLIEPGYYYYIKDSNDFSFGNNDLYIFYLKIK